MNGLPTDAAVSDAANGEAPVKRFADGRRRALRGSLTEMQGLQHTARISG